MKALYILALCALAHNAMAQDYCKQVRKEVSDDKTQTDYASPGDNVPLMPIVIRRSINTNPEYASDNFTVFFQLLSSIESIYNTGADGSQKEKLEKKLVIEFDDNSKYTDDTLEVNHDFTEDRTMAIRNLYMPVSDQAAKDLASKKIVKFSLGGYERAIPADTAAAMMRYFQCIKDKK